MILVYVCSHVWGHMTVCCTNRQKPEIWHLESSSVALHFIH